jgi:hypothetical protein
LILGLSAIPSNSFNLENSSICSIGLIYFCYT